MSKILLAPLLKPFNSRTSINPLENLNFHFAAVDVVDITRIEYFLSVFLSSFIKIFENLWKWFKFIHYLFLSITHVFQLCLYMYMLFPLKGVFAAYMHIVYLSGIAGI